WSLLFYFWGEQAYVLVMLGSIAANWGFGLGIGRARSERARRTWLGAGVAANVLLLVAFKYLGFLSHVLNDVLGLAGAGPVAVADVHLPIGISFYTFQALSYLVDVFREEAPARRDPVDFGLYIALFPQLIAGPIVRYRQIAAELESRVVTSAGFAWGVRRFVIGLGKK
ncbi:MAG: hypothetical protein KC420_23525, partial [Myxococcales bacterium]|nr:hypothetical protein [Myxococcales bacterium]